MSQVTTALLGIVRPVISRRLERGPVNLPSSDEGYSHDLSDHGLENVIADNDLVSPSEGLLNRARSRLTGVVKVILGQLCDLHLAEEWHNFESALKNLQNNPGDIIKLETEDNSSDGFSKPWEATTAYELIHNYNLRLRPRELGNIEVLKGALSSAGSSLLVNYCHFQTKSDFQVERSSKYIHITEYTYHARSGLVLSLTEINGLTPDHADENEKFYQSTRSPTHKIFVNSLNSKSFKFRNWIGILKGIRAINSDAPMQQLDIAYNILDNLLSGQNVFSDSLDLHFKSSHVNGISLKFDSIKLREYDRKYSIYTRLYNHPNAIDSEDIGEIALLKNGAEIEKCHVDFLLDSVCQLLVQDKEITKDFFALVSRLKVFTEEKNSDQDQLAEVESKILLVLYEFLRPDSPVMRNQYLEKLDQWFSDLDQPRKLTAILAAANWLKDGSGNYLTESSWDEIESPYRMVLMPCL